VCNRTSQATTAISCSLIMWWLSGLLFIWVVMCLSLELAASGERNNRQTDSYGRYTNSYYSRSGLSYWDYPCYYSLGFVPPGVTAIAGILSAASLLLHGHFVALVPEALHNMNPSPDPLPESAPADSDTQAQPPPCWDPSASAPTDPNTQVQPPKPANAQADPNYLCPVQDIVLIYPDAAHRV
jgi:hypothetical protein